MKWLGNGSPDSNFDCKHWRIIVYSKDMDILHSRRNTNAAVQGTIGVEDDDEEFQK